LTIQRTPVFRAHRIDGPYGVLVSLRLGQRPGPPSIVRLLTEGKDDPVIRFDLQRHIAEVLAGVARANREAGGSLQVESIEVVPDDTPRAGDAEQLAYEIARAVLTGAL
jgi:hypothetical protein